VIDETDYFRVADDSAGDASSGASTPPPE